MPNKYTTNYQLSQWEAEDRILHTDFNADNAKLEAALSDLEKRLARAERANRNMAYYIGQIAIMDYAANSTHLGQLSVGFEDFSFTSDIKTTGGVKAVGKTMQLDAGKTGSFTLVPGALFDKDWTRAHIFVLSQNGASKLEINGKMISYARWFSAKTPEGAECYAWETIWDRKPGENMSINVHMDANVDLTMKIFGVHYFVF